MVGALAEGEPDDMVADVAGPGGDEFAETPPVVGKQRTRGFLEADAVAGHYRHEVVGGVSRRAMPVAIAADAARFVD
jgi:hypothetical protein